MSANKDLEEGGGSRRQPQEYNAGYTVQGNTGAPQPATVVLIPRKRMSNKPIAITFVIGAILIIGGLTTGILWSQIYDTIISTELSVTPTSTNFGMWKESPIPIYLKLYVFDWTNAEESIVQGGPKPHFNEMGPYVFRQVDFKVNRVWNSNNTITFQRKRVWYFEPDMSSGSLNDTITTLNPVVASVAFGLRYQNNMMRDLVGRVMRTLDHKVIMTRTVGEMLFDGYNDTMLLIAKKMKLTKMPFTKFGWFYGRNNSETYDGTFNMDTGASNLLDVGMVKEWNFSNRTESYKGECGEIRGSNGELWPPLPHNDTISVFVTDICTDLKLKFENETTHEGLVGNKYHADYTLLDDGTLNRERKCYCEDIECIPSGMMNISRCKFDAPVFVSMPHYYLADPVYLNAVDGLEPSKDKHDMEVIIQPSTGIPMKVRAQLQLNVLLQPDSKMSMLKDVKRFFVPMMWFSQEATLTSDYASQVKLLLILPSLGTITCYGIAGIGFILLFISIFMLVRRKWQDDEGQVLLPKGNDHDINRMSE